MTLFGNTNTSLLQVVQPGTGFLVTGEMLKMPLTNLPNTPWVVPAILGTNQHAKTVSTSHFSSLGCGCVATPPDYRLQAPPAHREHHIFSPTFYEFDLLGVFFTNIGLFGVLNSASLKLDNRRWHSFSNKRIRNGP